MKWLKEQIVELKEQIVELHRVMFYPNHLDTILYLFLWGFVIVGVPVIALILLIVAILL